MNPVRDDKMCYVYVLKSINTDYWYTGVTNDLRKRFSQHQEGQRGWSRQHRPYKLIYYEACRDMNDATAREKYLKTGMGKRYLRNRLKRFLSLTG
jgi:putative endonuclease